MSAGVWASDDKVKETIRRFTYIQQCPKCQRYFCEMENLGSHACYYHPGKFDPQTGTMTCCGEKLNQNLGNYTNVRFAPRCSYVTPPSFSAGCKRRDCLGSDKFVPYCPIDIRDIASLLPFMDKFQERPGFKKGESEGVILRQ